MQFIPQLLKQLNNHNTPSTIPLKPEAYSQADNCFYNVVEKTRRDKGRVVYGWKIHSTPILLEAERHAVWESNDGERIDITPDEKYIYTTLFLEEDKGWIYKGAFADNIRLNITKNPLVDDYILLSETITKLYQTRTRMSATEFGMNAQVLQVVQYLEKDKAVRERFIYSDNSVESICYCGQPVKYKDCHGLNLKFSLNTLLQKVLQMNRV